jgi:hypothetical protein
MGRLVRLMVVVIEGKLLTGDASCFSVVAGQVVRKALKMGEWGRAIGESCRVL